MARFLDSEAGTIIRAIARFRCPDEARRWFREQPLPGFDGATAETLVADGQGGAVLEHLAALGSGGYA